MRYYQLAITRPVRSFTPGGSNPIRQRCWESEAKGLKSKHSRIRNHPGFQVFLSAGLSFFFRPFFGVSSDHRAHSIFTTPDTNLRLQTNPERTDSTNYSYFIPRSFRPWVTASLIELCSKYEGASTRYSTNYCIYASRALFSQVGKRLVVGSAWQKRMSIDGMKNPRDLHGMHHLR